MKLARKCNAMTKMVKEQDWECNGIPTQMLILRRTEQTLRQAQCITEVIRKQADIGTCKPDARF